MIVTLNDGIIKTMVAYSYSKSFRVFSRPYNPELGPQMGTNETFLHWEGVWPVDIWVDGRLVPPIEPVLISKVRVSILVWSRKLFEAPKGAKYIPITREEAEIDSRCGASRKVEFEYVGYNWDKKKTTKIKLGSPYIWQPGKTGLAELPNEDIYRFIDIANVFYGPGLNIVWVTLRAWVKDPYNPNIVKPFPAVVEGEINLTVE